MRHSSSFWEVSTHSSSSSQILIIQVFGGSSDFTLYSLEIVLTLYAIKHGPHSLLCSADLIYRTIWSSLLSETCWALVPNRQNNVLTYMLLWRALHKKATQTLISISSHSLSVSLFSCLSQELSLSQSFIPSFETARKIAHMSYSSPGRTKFGNVSVEKPLKPTEKKWGSWGCILLLKRMPLKLLNAHILSGSWILKFSIYYTIYDTYMHYLNKCANSQYVLQAIYLLPTIFNAIPLGLFKVSP